MRRAVTFALGVILLLLAPTADAGKRHPSLVIEDGYRQALEVFAAGSFVEAVHRVELLETESSPQCLLAIERRTAELFSTRQPEAIVPQAYLRLGVRQARYRTRGESRQLFHFETFSLRSVEGLVDIYVATSRANEASSLAAGLVAYAAHGVASLRSRGRLAVSTGLLRAALELDPEHAAARLSLAVALELQGLNGEALRHLDRLAALEPENLRLLMRRAVVAVKSGALERGESLLRELRTADSAWARDLATQELVRLLVAGGRQDEAVALLRQELEELPREKLSLQLAALLDPQWIDSWEALAAWLVASDGDAGPSARWIYEGSAKVEIDALRAELGAAVTERLGRLASGLSRLPDLEDGRRKILSGCR